MALHIPPLPRRQTAVLMAVVLITGGFLRLTGLGTQSLWHDEVLTYNDATVPLSRAVSWVRDHENSPPLYFVLVNAWVKVFGASDVSLRLPSALAGITSIVFLFALGAEYFHSSVGLTAAASLALSPMHVA